MDTYLIKLIQQITDNIKHIEQTLPHWADHSLILALISIIGAALAGAILMLLRNQGKIHIRMLRILRLKQQTETIYATLPVEILIVDRNGKIRLNNQLKSESGNEQKLSDLFDRELCGRLYEVIGNVIDTSQPQTLEFRQGGNWKRATIQQAPAIFDCHCALFCTQNVTETYQLREENHQVNQLLHDILNHLPCEVFVKEYRDLGRYILCNQAFARSNSYADENDPIGKTDYDLYPAELADQFIREDELVLTSQQPHHTEQDVYTPQGTLSHTYTLKTALPRTNGRTLLLGVNFDIKDIVELRMQLFERQALLRILLDHLPVCIVVKDPQDEFRIKLWNQGAEVITGIAASNAIGKQIADLGLEPQFSELVATSDRLVMQTNKSEKLLEQVVFPNGRKTMMMMQRHPFVSNKNQKLLLSIGVDVSHQLELEENHELMQIEQSTFLRQQQILNGCLSTIAIETDFEKTMTEILNTIGSLFHPDRLYLVTADPENASIRFPFEWNSCHSSAKIDKLPKPTLQQLRRHIELLKTRRIYNTTSPEVLGVHEIPEYATRLKALRGFCCNGLWCNGEFWGAFGMSFLHQEYMMTPEDEQLIRSICRILELALEREQKREQLLVAQKEQALIFDSVLTPLLFFDNKMNLLQANSAAYTMGHTTREEAANTPCHHLFCGNNHIAEHCPVRLAIHTGLPQERELMINDRRILAKAQPIFNARGHVTHVIESCFDITRVYEEQQRLAHAVEQIQKSEQTQHRLMLFAENNLRKPLAAICQRMEQLSEFDNTNPFMAELATSLAEINDQLIILLQLAQTEQEQSVPLPLKSDWKQLLQVTKQKNTDQRQPPAFSGQVLLVDDVPMNLKVFSAMMRLLHVPHRICSSGKEALQLVEQEQFSAIFTDLWMPGINGWQLARRLKENPVTAPIPLIAVTADLQAERAHDDNFFAYLSKPLTKDRIARILAQLSHQS